MSFKGKIYKQCPECEGYGKKINYFDLPNPIDIGIISLHIMEIKTERKTKAGRNYLEKELCEMCDGVGMCWQF
jgi:hypothetical protein